MGDKEVFITGYGIVTAIGLNAKEVYRSLTEATSGIGPPKILDTVHKNDIPVGEVPLRDEAIKSLLGYPQGKAITRTSLLGHLAVREAIERAGISRLDPYRTGLVNASTVGGMSSSEKYWDQYMKNDIYDEYIQEHDLGVSTWQIAKFFGIKDYLSTISTACSSSANAIMLGVRLIKNGVVDRVVAGGTDALSKFTVNGFNSLMILDHEPTKPFDNDRKGLNLGEGAAYLVLEAGGLVENKRVYGKISGYANTNDSFHQTASSENGYGCYLSMKRAINSAGIEPEDINYINVHGTGTPNNDLTEGRAIKKLFDDKVPPFSSTKPFTGHTLGAAGAVEAVISLLSLESQLIFPNMNFQQPVEELGMYPVTSLKEKKINHVLSNSLGFGGNDASLVISKSS